MKALGIFCYTQSLLITADKFDITTEAVLEMTKGDVLTSMVKYSIRNVRHMRVPFYTNFPEFIENHKDTYGLIYGQPYATGNVREKQQLKFAVDVASNMLRTKNILFVVPTRTQTQDYWTQYFSNLKSNYRWTLVRVNAMALGVPVNTEYMIIIGNKEDKSPRLENFSVRQISDIPVIYPFIQGLENVLPTTTGAIYDKDGIVMDGHNLLSFGNAFKDQLIWQSIPLLKEGQKLYDIKERPQAWHDRNGKVLKTQLPIRLDRYMPMPKISFDPKFIHPTKNRVMTLRELARIIEVPDTYSVGSCIRGHRILANFIPKKVSEYAFSLIDRIQRNVVAENPTYVDISREFVKAFRKYKNSYSTPAIKLP